MQLKIEKAEWNTENEKQYRPLRQDGNKYESNLSNVSCLNTPIKRLPMWIKRQLYVVYKKLNLNTLCKNKGVENFHVNTNKKKFTSLKPDCRIREKWGEASCNKGVNFLKRNNNP